MTDSTEQMVMIEDCMNREEKLSDWERGFIDSIQRQLIDGRSLTPKQADILDNIWEKVT